MHIVLKLFTAATWTHASETLPKNMAVSGVYAIRRKGTVACYVGSSINCRVRLVKHLNDLRIAKHHSKHLQRAWIKYGELSFEVAVIESAARPDLISCEQAWIERLDSFVNGYNGRPIAEANYGVVWSDEQNEARRASNRKAWSDPERRAQLSKKFKGIYRANWTEESTKKAVASALKFGRTQAAITCTCANALCLILCPSQTGIRLRS